MRATVDEEGCRGHGVCAASCPGVFALNDDGYSVVHLPEIPAELQDAVRAAAANCPERAITVR
jgi:ferredoxin